MNVPEDEAERPLAWQAILADTPVYSADGTEVGTLVEVLGAEQQDIFHGIVVGLHSLSRDVVVPAASVLTITNRRIQVGLSAEAMSQLEPYQAEASYHLGFVGLLGRRLGWVDEENKRV